MTQATNQVETVVALTEAAAGQVSRLLAADPGNAGKSLRVLVEGGGCSGLQYGMVFDGRQENDVVNVSFGVEVYVDAGSVEHLRGAVVDYKDDLNESGFRISNPKARNTCGCGKSFEGCC